MNDSEHQQHLVVLIEALEVLSSLECYFDEDECDWILLTRVYLQRIIRKVKQRIEDYEK